MLEDNLAMCKLMEKMISNMGVTKISIFNSYSDLTKLSKDQLNFDIAFLDVNLGIGQKSGIDAFDWLIANDFKGTIIFLTGHAGSYEILKKISCHPNVHLLDKPAEITKIQSYICD